MRFPSFSHGRTKRSARFVASMAVAALLAVATPAAPANAYTLEGSRAYFVAEHGDWGWQYIHSVTAVPNGLAITLHGDGLEYAESLAGAYEIALMVDSAYTQIPGRTYYDLHEVLEPLAVEIWLHANGRYVPGFVDNANPVNVDVPAYWSGQFSWVWHVLD